MSPAAHIENPYGATILGFSHITGSSFFILFIISLPSKYDLNETSKGFSESYSYDVS